MKSLTFSSLICLNLCFAQRLPRKPNLREVARTAKRCSTRQTLPSIIGTSLSVGYQAIKGWYKNRKINNATLLRKHLEMLIVYSLEGGCRFLLTFPSPAAQFVVELR